MRVLVTGATGLIGLAISERLAREKHHVVALGRVLSAALPATVEQIHADIAAEEFPENVLRGVAPCEAIVHAAADRSAGLDTAHASRVNCEGTQRVVALAAKWRSSVFIHTSGVAVIGQPLEIPITEEHPCCPPNPYLAAKLYSEHLTNMVRQWGGRGISLRITAPIGPLMPSNRIVSRFLGSALKGVPLRLNGTGARQQDYVDVGDIALAVLLCLESSVSGIFNIASAHSVSNLELAKLCIGTTNSSSGIEFTGVPDPEDHARWDVSIEKARAQLGYTPRISLEQSLADIARASNSTSVERVVSGGQTGVDRAALDAAMELALPCGGWCPKDRLAEDGRIDNRYPLQETPTGDYAERTECNVRDSDGTLVLTWGEASGGTAQTIRIAHSLTKPCLTIDLAQSCEPETARDWLRRHGIKTLNIAGPRASASPEVYPRARAFLQALLSRQ